MWLVYTSFCSFGGLIYLFPAFLNSYTEDDDIA